MIIELETESALDVSEFANDENLLELQKQEVAAAQDVFLQDMAPYLFGDTRFDVQRKALLPFVTLRLSSEGIRHTASHSSVKTIASEGLGQELLQDTIPQIGADTAHSQGYDGSGWTVAIIDSGVDYTHSFLNGSLISEACYSTADPRSSELCYNGISSGSTSSGAGRECSGSYNCNHGTQMAGIALGSGSTRDGVSLNANLFSIMAKAEVDTCPQNQTPCLSDKYRESDVADALERIYNLRNTYQIASVNMSIALSTVNSDFSDTDCGASWTMVRQYVNLLTYAHIGVVASSGNFGNDGDRLYQNKIAPPACIAKVIAVAAVDKNDTFADYSNAGDNLDLLAPGGLDTSGVTSSDVGGGFVTNAGTSQASAHVAGSIAALREKYPYPSVSAIEGQLEDTGLDESFSQTGIYQGTQNYTIPIIRVDDALDGQAAPAGKPSTFTVSKQFCYGQNELDWSSVSGNVTEYQVEGSIYSNYSNGSRWYAGPNTSTFVNVSQTTYFRVRACNLVSCGPWKNAGSTADVYPGCA